MTYSRHPSIACGPASTLVSGWERIAETVTATGARIVMVDAYPGVDPADLETLARTLDADVHVSTCTAMRSDELIQRLTSPDLGDDPVFGRITGLTLNDFFDAKALAAQRAKIRDAEGSVLVTGPGAALLSAEGLVIFADMPRWETIQRQRGHKISNLGLNNPNERPAEMYRRGYFVDWRVADRHKNDQWERIDFLLDTTDRDAPKLVDAVSVNNALRRATTQPFRVMPFFDPAPWGGEWMQDVCNVGRDQPNLGWCFDCVPEENSLLLDFDGVCIELPAIDLVFREPRALLGTTVYGRFGAEFPIRTDFLDTMGGGNLSLQVHPLSEYIHAEFGMSYTQDESYYVMAAKDGACVHLGVTDDVDAAALSAGFHGAEDSKSPLDHARYVNTFPAKAHDHFLIPAGTIHGSGANTMVFEISSTPYIFTFKMYDWQRAGLDGLPRPLHVDRGLANLQWHRDRQYAQAKLINCITPIAAGDGWHSERTGLHDAEFIETHRHWFTSAVTHKTSNTVEVLNLVAGDAAVVESPDNQFEPFSVSYAETFIVPAAAGDYTITPAHKTQKCATIKAFVRQEAT